MNATDGEILKQYIEKNDVNRTRFAEALETSTQNLYQLLKSKQFKAETIKKVEAIIGKTWEELKGAYVDTNVGNILNEDELPYGDLAMKAIVNLTESNKSIADSNKSIADSNASLARSNEELVRMVKSSTVDAQMQNQQDAEAMRSVVLELLFEVASGKRWKSSDEVGAIYRKRLSDAMGLMKEKDIQKSSDRQHTLKGS